MYLSHWKLSAKPFEHTFDSDYLYAGAVHHGAMLKLRYAVENHRGVAVLTGPAGLGKTMLSRLLAKQLGEEFSPIIFAVFPQLDPGQLISYLAARVTGESPVSGESTAVSLTKLENALQENLANGKHAVIVFDEAQLLTENDTLETVRLLTNLHNENGPLLSVVLVGNSSLLPILDRMPELDQRTGVKCLLRSLTREETASYVNHRLAVAGAEKEIFDQRALGRIYEFSQGVPRQINRICDLALLIGFAEEHDAISAEQIEAVAEELFAIAPE